MTTLDLSRFTPLEQRLLQERPLTEYEQGLDLRQVARIRELAYRRQFGQLSEEEAARESLLALSAQEQQALAPDNTIDVVDAQRRGVPDLVLRGLGIQQETVARANAVLAEEARYKAAIEEVRPFMDAEQRVDLRKAIAGGVSDDTLRLLFSAEDVERAKQPAVSSPVAPPAIRLEGPTAELTNWARRVLGIPYQELGATATGPDSNVPQERALFEARLGRRRQEVQQELASRRRFFELEIQGAQQQVRGWENALARSYLERAGGDVNAAVNLYLQDYPYRDYLITPEVARERLLADHAAQRQELQAARDRVATKQADLIAYDNFASQVLPRFDAEADGARAALEGRIVASGGSVRAPEDLIREITRPESIAPPEAVAIETLFPPGIIPEEELPGDVDFRRNEALAELQRRGFATVIGQEAQVEVARASLAGHNALLEQVGFGRDFIQREVLTYQSDVQEDERTFEAYQRLGPETHARNAAMAQLMEYGLASSSGQIDIIRALETNRHSLLLQAGFTPGQLAAYQQEIEFLKSGQETATPRLALTPYQVIVTTPEALEQAAQRQREIDQELYGLRGVVREVDEGIRGPEVRAITERTINRLANEKADLEQYIVDTLPTLSEKYQRFGLPNYLVNALLLGEVAVQAGRATPGTPQIKGGAAIVAAAVAATVMANYLADNPAADQRLATTQRQSVTPDMVSPPGLPLVRPPQRLGGFSVAPPSSIAFVPLRGVPRELTELPPWVRQAPPEVVTVLQAATAVVEDERRIRDSYPGIPESVSEFLKRPTVAEPLDRIIDEAILAVPRERRSSLRQDLRELARKREILDEARREIVVSQGFPPEQRNDIQVLQQAIAFALTPRLVGGTTPSRAPRTAPSPLRGAPDRPDPRDLPEPTILTPAIGVPLDAETARQTIVELDRLIQQGTNFSRQQSLANSLQVSFILNPALRSQLRASLRAGLAQYASTARLAQYASTARLAQYASTARLAQISSSARTQARASTRTTTRPAVRTATRATTRTATRTAVVPITAITSGIIVPVILPEDEPPPKPKKPLAGDFPEVVGWNTGVTDHTVNLVTDEHQWHSDLPEIPEIPARESYTVLTRGPKWSPERVYPMGISTAFINTKRVDFTKRIPQPTDPRMVGWVPKNPITVRQMVYQEHGPDSSWMTEVVITVEDFQGPFRRAIEAAAPGNTRGSIEAAGDVLSIQFPHNTKVAAEATRDRLKSAIDQIIIQAKQAPHIKKPVSPPPRKASVIISATGVRFKGRKPKKKGKKRQSVRYESSG